jgi:peptidoglycan/LPS O-acetylase OafA/YrhL
VPGKLYFAMAIAAVLMTAVGGYLAVEKPFMELRKRYVARPAPSAPPSVEQEVSAPPPVVTVG